VKAEGALLNLATSIADGGDVDWAAAEAAAQDDQHRALIRSLKLIASIGELHRTIDEDTGLEPPAKGRIVGRIGPPPENAAPDALPLAAPSAAPATPVAPSPVGGTPTGTVRASASFETETTEVETWGTLRLIDRVGNGVFGEVYRAYDEQLQREVALKLLKPGTRSTNRLIAKVLHEGRLLARVRHPNVVNVYGVETHHGRVGLWMEFIKGCTLEQLLQRQGLFGAREAALVGQDLCRALAAVHASGLIHRDVKAQNVMREEGGRVVLMDFGTGIPRREEEAGESSPAAGTPLYLAPELLDGQDASIASDIYGLGVLLFHLVTGTYPVSATSLNGMREAHQQGSRHRLQDARPDLPDAFVQAVDRALAPNPGQRYASVGAMQEALTRALGVEAVSDTPAVIIAPEAAPPPSAKGWKANTRRWILPAAVVTLVAAAAAAWGLSSLSQPAPGPINSIVVLPFANLSNRDKDLAEGINLRIADRLAMLPGLRVVQYSARRAEHAQGLSVSDIIRREQVDAAIQGTVSWDGTRARAYVHLIRAGAGSPDWTKQFDLPLSRVADLPRDVARDVAAATAVKLTPGDDDRLTESPAPAAFEAYLRGRVALRIGTPVETKRAIGHFQEAIRLDPTHGPSYASLAACYINQAVAQRVIPVAEGAALAREAVNKALQLDNRLPEAYGALADLSFFIDWDWAVAERAFKQALTYNPNSGELRERYAMFLASRKKLPDAMQEVQQAVALDPTSPLANAALGMLWHYLRQDDLAERVNRGVLELDPSYRPARIALIRVLIALKRHEEALRELDHLQSVAEGEPSPAELGARGAVYVALGRTGDAEAIVERLMRDDRDGPSVDAASVLAALGQHERALDILEQAVDRRMAKVLFLRLDRRFDPLRGHQRFAELLQRMGLES